MTSKNNPANWERRLAGDVIAIIDGEPDYGFYRVRSRDKLSWRAVAYWYAEDGGLRCRLDGRDLDEQRANELWSYASQHPITHELYKAVIAGEPWPDLNPEVTRSNQAPDDNSFEALQERIDDLAREAERLMKAGAAKTQDQADQAADVANKLAELRGKAERQRVREKEPHLGEARAVDDKWRPIIGAADIYARLKDAVCKPWLAAQKAAKDRAEAEACRKAQEAADAARRAEEEARRKAAEAAQTGDAAAAAEAARKTREAQAATEKAAEVAQNVETVAATSITAGTRGRGVHLRGKTVVTIEDRAAVLTFFHDRQEITDLLQSMAEKAVRAGITVPGTKVEKDAQAA
jgi:hypothetical protein